MEAYQKTGLTYDDLERGRYVRISEIQKLRKTRPLDTTLRWTQLRVAVALSVRKR